MKNKRLAVLSFLGILAFGGLAITSLTGCESQETEDTTEGNDGTTNEGDTTGGTTIEDPTTGGDTTDDETKTDGSETDGSEGGNTGGSEVGDSETDEEDSSYIKDGSFELSGASEELLSRYWTETGADGSTTNWDQDTSEGEYSFNKYWESASSETYTLAQTSTFTVTKEDTYILSYSLMGSDALGITVGIYEENGNEVATSSNYSGWTDTAADRYNELTVSLSADTNYLFKLTLTNIAEGTWFTLDDITLEKYVEPVTITGVTSAYEGEDVELTANKDVSWEIIDGASYGSLSTTTGATTKVTLIEGSAEQTIIIKATSTTEGEEDNYAIHTISILEASENLVVTVDKTKIYDGHSVTFTPNKEVTYSFDIDDGYSISGNTIVFSLGLEEYGETKEVEVTASDGTNDVTTTITVYSTMLTNNGTFDREEGDGYDPEYYGWKDMNNSSSNLKFWLSDHGYATIDSKTNSGEDTTIESLGLYFEFNIIEDDVDVLYTAHYSKSGWSGWGSVKFYDEEFDNQIGNTIWSDYDNAETNVLSLSEGTYNFGYFVEDSDDARAWKSQETMWIGIYTLTLTVV